MEKLKNLQQSFSTMRLVTFGALAVTALTILLAGGLVLYAYGAVGQRVYVVGQGGSTQMALADSPESHTQFEMRNLVRQFAENMYGHDQYTYKSHLNVALPLIDDAGGRQIFQMLKNQDVLGSYIKFGARTAVTIDSIALDAHALPVHGRLYMRQTAMVGDRQSKSEPIGCDFDLTNTYRSERNPFGMVLTRFKYFAYRPEMTDAEKRRLQAQAARDAADMEQARAAAAQSQREGTAQ